MIVNGEDLRVLSSGPGKFGGSQMAAYLYTRSLDGMSADDESGDCQAPTGWFARMGKWVIIEDDQGFVYSHKHDTEDQALAAFDELMTEYARWAMEGDEE